jgi:hypothetical protein
LFDREENALGLYTTVGEPSPAARTCNIAGNIAMIDFEGS